MDRLAALHLLLAAAAFPATAQERVATEQHRATRLTLTAQNPHADPLYGVRLRARATHRATGDTVSALGFWDGGATYRVNLSFGAIGTWDVVTSASDRSDAGLQGQRFEVTVAPPTDTTLLGRYGPLRVAANQTTLAWGNGQPVFFLSDSASEGVWRASREEIDRYLDTRAAQGFVAVQVIVQSHQMQYDNGVTNREGQGYHADASPTRLNPRYFDLLDYWVQGANRRGLTVGILPLFGTFASVHRDISPHRWLLTAEQAERLGEYVGARYAGNAVFWIVGGDARYETAEQRAYWSGLARALHRAGPRRLTTVHPGGYADSFDYFDEAAGWVDFDEFQASHLFPVVYDRDGSGRIERDRFGSNGYGAVHWREGLEAAANPRRHRPFLSAEANCEDIFAEFWSHPDTTTTFRMPAYRVREALWWATLSGAKMGFGYCANGVWQWHTPALWHVTFSPRYTFDRALAFPGAQDVAWARRFAEREAWWSWAPDLSLIEVPSENGHVAIAKGLKGLYAFFPRSAGAVELRPEVAAQASTVTWIPLQRPADSSRVSLTSARLSPPVLAEDWLAVVRPPQATDSAAWPRPATRARLVSAQPARGVARVEIDGPVGFTGELFDVMGRRLWRRALDRGVNEIALPSPGLFVLRIQPPGLPPYTLRIVNLGR